ncbi:MAG: folate-binding protein [Pseudomonadota bacterium]
MTGEAISGRRIIRVSGTDAFDFLQGLVSNDVSNASAGLVYAALLTPQGKYLADFFILSDDAGFLLDVAETLADAFVRRLSMYKLRADVVLEQTELFVTRGLGPAPDTGFADPRHPGLGWRAYGDTEGQPETTDWEHLRVELGVPESTAELIPDETYILEAGFERLHGVDFKKGCYVGQEVTARMKHKTALRKGLVRVAVDGAADAGTEILAGGKSAGRLFSQSHGLGLAHLRFDRAKGPMQAGQATVTWDGQAIE